MKRVYRIGTRGSALALAQTGLVIEELKARIPGFQAEPVIIRTTGDRIQDRSLAESGGKGLFVKELERALQDGKIDFAVHSGRISRQQRRRDFPSVPSCRERIRPICS